MIRYLDVCSGYSAFTLASAGLGFQCVGYSEIEAFPRAILEQRHGAAAVEWDHRHRAGANSTPLFGDFTQIEAHHVGPVDLLAGGTPCQAFSVAGKRLGLDDPRGNLTLEFLALARRVRAPWLVWENVPGFLSHDGGRTMGTFLRLLGQLGYGWAYRVLDAQYIRVDGFEGAVPQRRRRLFVVAHLGDAAGPAAVLFERESLRGHPAPRREARQGIASAAIESTGSGGLAVNISDGQPRIEAITGTLSTAMRRGSAQNSYVATPPFIRPDLHAPDIAASLTRGAESSGKGGYAGRRQEDDVNLVAHSLRAEGSDASEDGTGRGTPLIPVCVHADAIGRSGDAATPSIDGNGVARLRDAGMGVSEGAAFGLTTGQPHAVAYSIMPQNSGKDYKAREVEVAQPLMAGGPVGGNQGGDYIAQPQDVIAFDWQKGDGGADESFKGKSRSWIVRAGQYAGALGTTKRDAIATPWAVRRLTPTECERLMGVPDGFTAITYRGKPAADGPRYKALGNSQAVNCMRWIAHGVADVMAAQAKGIAA